MKKFLAILFSVVILATFMAVPALAADSPSGKVIYKVEIKGQSTVNNVEAGKEITLVKTDKDKTFTGWVIEGEYKIVSGTKDSDTFVIIPLSDLKITETYKEDTTTPPATENESNKAPQTGNGTLMVTILLTAGAFVTMVATKKAVRS